MANLDKVSATSIARQSMRALKGCIPLHFSAGMAGAVAGRPIAIRFVDDRTIDKQQDEK
jgi:hypothetical protein